MDGVRHDYTYASGQLLRESFTLDGHSYVYDFLYDQSGRPYMLNYISNGYSSRYYYVLNLQGDVMALVTSEGVEVAKYTYDAWGNVTPDTTLWLSNRNPLRYRGYYYDTETGFYYLQSRYYDPALGRFINADSYASTGQGFLGYNMFAYCGNNPAASFDHYGTYATAIGFGRSDECVWGAAGGGGIVGIGLLTWLCQILSTESRGNQTTIKEAGDGATSVSGGAITQAANQKAQLPSSKKITINMDHILSGHSAGGNRGGPRKSRFPSWMTAARLRPYNGVN